MSLTDICLYAMHDLLSFQKYEGTFRWAVVEALRLHTNYMPAKGKGLEVILFEGAAIGPNLPEFLVASCKVCDLGKVIPGYQAEHDPTVSLSRDIRKTGGIGAVTVVFSFWKNAESGDLYSGGFSFS